jgi:hypothetical protein
MNPNQVKSHRARPASGKPPQTGPGLDRTALRPTAQHLADLASPGLCVASLATAREPRSRVSPFQALTPTARRFADLTTPLPPRPHRGAALPANPLLGCPTLASACLTAASPAYAYRLTARDVPGSREFLMPFSSPRPTCARPTWPWRTFPYPPCSLRGSFRLPRIFLCSFPRHCAPCHATAELARPQHSTVREACQPPANFTHTRRFTCQL